MPKERNSRTNIANLFGVLKNFKPELDPVTKGWDGVFLVNEGVEHAPDRDEILHMIGLASGELIEFMKNHDQLMNDHENILGAVKRIHEIVGGMMNLHEERGDLIANLETVAGRYQQLIDIVHHIAHDLPSDKCKSAAQKFLEFKGDNLNPLVNQNVQESVQANAGSGEPLCTCQKAIATISIGCPFHGANPISIDLTDQSLLHNQPVGRDGMVPPEKLPGAEKENPTAMD